MPGRPSTPGSGWPPLSSPAVKICGVRRLADALVAADAGADYIGIVFVPGRRRRLEPAAARRITDGLRARDGIDGRDGRRPQVVGLFGDQPLPAVLDTIAAAGLDGVQLCGAESVAYCRRVQQSGAAVIKVLHIADDSGAGAALAAAIDIDAVSQSIDAYAAAGCTITLDRQVAGLHGGTGQSFDWRIAARLSERHRFMLAGGLTPDNVADAVKSAHPWGVDVSSGVETDGVQDPDQIRRFIANARRAH